MKAILFFLAVTMFTGFCIAQAEEGKQEGLSIYMPYSKMKDHMVVGIELPGYHMRYDIAKNANIFMVLLPDGFDEMKKAPVYFSIDTSALGNYSVNDILENDLAALAEENKGLKVVTRFDGKTLSKAGECNGAELSYPDHRLFPNEVFYYCKSRSDKYAILLSIAAKSKEELDRHLPDFIRWANAPQFVTDSQVIEIPEQK